MIFYDMIKRMIPIWNMWVAIRLLRKKQHIYAFGSSLSNESPRSDFGEVMVEIMNRTARVPVMRAVWVADMSYLIQKRENRKEKLKNPLLFSKKWFRKKNLGLGLAVRNTNRANDIVDDCLSAGFIELVPSYETNKVRLTTLGSNFSYFSFLLKYLKKELGETYAWLFSTIFSVILGALLVLAFLLGKITLQGIWDLFIKLF